jgi:hypothetical protein
MVDRRILVPLDGSILGEAALAGGGPRAVKTAASKKLALIVMGSHRVRPGPPANGRGTTSYKVVT